MKPRKQPIQGVSHYCRRWPILLLVTLLAASYLGASSLLGAPKKALLLPVPRFRGRTGIADDFLAPRVAALMRAEGARVATISVAPGIAWHHFNAAEGQAIGTADFLKGGVEGQIKHIFVSVLGRADPRTSVVWDVGMNSGLFTCLAASMGFEVHAFEPQPLCHNVVAATLALNPRLQGRVHTHRVAGASPAVAAAGRAITVGRTLCGPGNQVKEGGGHAQKNKEKKKDDADDDGPVSVPLVRISALRAGLAGAKTATALVKVDTEGSETGILRDLADFMTMNSPSEGGDRVVPELVVELVPHFWSARGSSVDEGVSAVTALANMAQRVLVLHDYNTPTIGVKPFGSHGWLSGPTSVDGVPGPFWEVTDLRAFLIDDRLEKRCGCNIWFSFWNSYPGSYWRLPGVQV